MISVIAFSPAISPRQNFDKGAKYTKATGQEMSGRSLIRTDATISE